MDRRTISPESLTEINKKLKELKINYKDQAQLLVHADDLIEEIRSLSDIKNDYHCIGKKPDGDVSIPLKESKESKESDNEGLNIDKALKEMCNLASESQKFSLYDDNCSKAVARILKRGFEDNGCASNIIGDEMKLQDSLFINYAIEGFARLFVNKVKGLDEASLLLIPKLLRAYTPGRINELAKKLEHISNPQDGRYLIPHENPRKLHQEFFKIISAYRNSIANVSLRKKITKSLIIVCALSLAAIAAILSPIVCGVVAIVAYMEKRSQQRQSAIAIGNASVSSAQQRQSAIAIGNASVSSAQQRQSAIAIGNASVSSAKRRQPASTTLDTIPSFYFTN